MAKDEKALDAVEEMEDAAKESGKASAKKSDKKPAKTAKKPKSDKPGFFKRIARFFKDLKGEVKKIVWPSRKQVVNNTLVVVITCVIVGIFVCGLDALLSLLLNLLFNKA